MTTKTKTKKRRTEEALFLQRLRLWRRLFG